jgi:hypothetical protein
MYKSEKVMEYLAKEGLGDWQSIQTKLLNAKPSTDKNVEVNTGITFVG